MVKRLFTLTVCKLLDVHSLWLTILLNCIQLHGKQEQCFKRMDLLVPVLGQHDWPMHPFLYKYCFRPSVLHLYNLNSPSNRDIKHRVHHKVRLFWLQNWIIFYLKKFIRIPLTKSHASTLQKFSCIPLLTHTANCLIGFADQLMAFISHLTFWSFSIISTTLQAHGLRTVYAPVTYSKQ